MVAQERDEELRRVVEILVLFQTAALQNVVLPDINSYSLLQFIMNIQATRLDTNNR